MASSGSCGVILETHHQHSPHTRNKEAEFNTHVEQESKSGFCVHRHNCMFAVYSHMQTHAMNSFPWSVLEELGTNDTLIKIITSG